MKRKTFTIADVGANHNKRLDLALSMIDICKKIGIDAIKFQTYSSETMYSKNTPDFANYKNIPDLIKSIELPREWQKDLKQYCDEKKIEFMSTPFDQKAVDELMDLGVKRFKIASFESSDEPFVRYIASTKKPIIFSTGLMDEKQLVKTLNWIYDENPSGEIVVMHCVSSYPTPGDQINLSTVSWLRRWLTHNFNNRNIEVGFSDHTEHSITPSYAVALGAKYIEKHFTIFNDLQGPDHFFAMNPTRLNEMMYAIEHVEEMMGSFEMCTQQCEKEMFKASRSVVAKRDIIEGTILEESDLTTKRPYLGDEYVHASEYYSLIGERTKVDIKEDDLIKKEWIS